jgi:hypothetical protein
LKVRVAVADLLKGPSIDKLSAELLTAVAPSVSEHAAEAESSADSWEEGSL